METQNYKHLNSTFTRVNQIKSRITIKHAHHAAKRHATNHEHYSHIYRPPGISVPIGGGTPVAVGVIGVPTEVIG